MPPQRETPTRNAILSHSLRFVVSWLLLVSFLFTVFACGKEVSAPVATRTVPIPKTGPLTPTPKNSLGIPIPIPPLLMDKTTVFPAVDILHLLVPPLSLPSPETWATENLEILVWGHCPGTEWQDKLYRHLKTDICWGLKKRNQVQVIAGMVRIPAGETIIGAITPPSSAQERLPAQKLYVPAFYIDRNEITKADYEKCVAERQCLPLYTPSPSHNSYGHDQPALITYKQAERYCRWAGKRLPTEYEWERAARGGDGRLYPWGDQEPNDHLANMCGDNCPFPWADKSWHDLYPFTAPVGSYPAGASPFGLLDMAGNVKEWVVSAQPLPPNVFLFRSSSWYSGREQLYAFYRQVWFPGVRLDDKGARCAVDAE